MDTPKSALCQIESDFFQEGKVLGNKKALKQISGRIHQS
jgi:hypothetical protein